MHELDAVKLFSKGWRVSWRGSRHPGKGTYGVGMGLVMSGGTVASLKAGKYLRKKTEKSNPDKKEEETREEPQPWQCNSGIKLRSVLL